MQSEPSEHLVIDSVFGTHPSFSPHGKSDRNGGAGPRLRTLGIAYPTTSVWDGMLNMHTYDEVVQPRVFRVRLRRLGTIHRHMNDAYDRGVEIL
jgi:hypothetical protein